MNRGKRKRLRVYICDMCIGNFQMIFRERYYMHHVLY